MNDLEMVRLCAEAMGFDDVRIETAIMGTQYVKHGPRSIACMGEFRPLHDDAQAMGLVKKFRLRISQPSGQSSGWLVHIRNSRGIVSGNPDLNRAIVECVAKMQASKS